MSKPAPLVRVINTDPKWRRVGDYPCGVEIEVTPDVAEALAARGFVRVDDQETVPTLPAIEE
mgnify:FL=1